MHQQQHGGVQKELIPAGEGLNFEFFLVSECIVYLKSAYYASTTCRNWLLSCVDWSPALEEDADDDTNDSTDNYDSDRNDNDLRQTSRTASTTLRLRGRFKVVRWSRSLTVIRLVWWRRAAATTTTTTTTTTTSDVTGTLLIHQTRVIFYNKAQIRAKKWADTFTF